MSKLKIYQFDWNDGGYGGGMMLVAAPNVETAIIQSKIDHPTAWKFDREMRELAYTGSPKIPHIITLAYYQE